MTARQLQAWGSGGLLTPAIPSHRTAAGGYTERRYTPIDLFELLVLAERAGGRTLSPHVVNGEQTQSARQEWEPNADEALYGLGQHQQGLMNIRDVDLDLHQYNS